MIFNYNNASLAQLKAFADEHGINPVGDRRTLQAWRDAIAQFMEAAQPVAEEVAAVAVETGRRAVIVATSPEALDLYKDCGLAAFYAAKLTLIWVARFVVLAFRLAMALADGINAGFDAAICLYDHPHAVKESAKVVAGLVAFEAVAVVAQAAEDSLMQFMGWVEGLGASAREEMAIALFALNEAVAEANC